MRSLEIAVRYKSGRGLHTSITHGYLTGTQGRYLGEDDATVDAMLIEIGRFQTIGDASNVRNNDHQPGNWNLEPTVGCCI